MPGLIGMRDTPSLISISGGRTSGMMVYKIMESVDFKPPPHWHFVFCNTSREHPATYKFLADMISHWGIDLICLEWRPKVFYTQVAFDDMATDSSIFFDLLTYGYRNHAPPNRFGRFCSKDLKQVPIKQFMKDKGYPFFNNVMGIRADEPARIRAGIKNYRKGHDYNNIYPLAEWGIKQRHIFEFWGQQSFDLELPIINGKNPYGNCLGCFNKSDAEIYMILQDDINALDDMIAHEQARNKPFRIAAGNERKDLWLADYKADVKNGKVSVKRGLELGLFCDASLGSCTD